jgi:hypothetical protein
VTAVGKRSNRVKKQAMIEFTIGRDLFEVNFFISPQLVHDAILGCEFVKEHGISLILREKALCILREEM